MAYVPNRDMILCLVKKSSGSDEWRTWRWRGNDWFKMENSNSPGGGGPWPMAYDEVQRRAFFIGARNTGLFGTYTDFKMKVWNGSRWMRVYPSRMPSARSGHALASDAFRGEVVLFGGTTSSLSWVPAGDDTWIWDGTNWTQHSPVHSPSPRIGHAMAFDVMRKKVVLFGGSSGSGYLNDTWEWDGSDWIQRSPATSPSARSGHAMAFLPARGRVVLFGGEDSGGLKGDTWEWDGSSWTRISLTPEPTPRERSGMAYYPAPGRLGLVLFGGRRNNWLDDTWEYNIQEAATFTAFGQGCAGSAGVPDLAAAPGQLPWIGTTFRMDLNNLPIGALNAAVGFLGFSDSAWGPLPLPLDLGFLGMTGCVLYVSIDLQFGLTNQAGWAPWDLPIPLEPFVLGLNFYTQALALDFQGPSSQMIISNAAVCHIGTM